jgi:hypothetical protein
LTGEKDPWLEAHEKCAKLFGEMITPSIPEVKDEELVIIKPEVEK